jgi:DNA-binding GntR family transcriptional regulator
MVNSQEPESAAIAVAPLFRPVAQRALRETVVASLLSAIFAGQLRESDALNAQRLAHELGVSATPVREALVELATIGMVETRHNRGSFVRSFGPVELRDIYHLRRVLEAEATRCACGRLPMGALRQTKQEMTELLKHQKRMGWSELTMAADRRFHQLIAKYCGSQRLAEEIGRYNTLMQCIRDVVGNQSYAQQRALPEHLQIIEELLRNEPDEAAAAMVRHIESSADTVARSLFPSADAG